MYFRYSLILFVCLLFHTGKVNAQEETKAPSLFFAQEENVLKLHGTNDQLYPLTIRFEFELKGLKLREKLAEFFVLPAQTDSLELVSFAIPEGRTWSYKYSYSYYLGDATAQHNEKQVYLLPFPEGSAFLLSQGYFGASSHEKEHALDFTMPEGTEVTAARIGTVVDLKEDSNRGCPSVDCNEFGNYIRILHQDGTLADYFHLKQHGALVALGQTVVAGETIGLAGDTGWASGSHLHFMVYKAGPHGRISIPTLFNVQGESNGVFLKEGERYLSIR